jgi:hypothetical protein
MPPLAYATETSSTDSVFVRCGTGAPHTLATFTPPQNLAPALAWSSDGTQLAWTTGSAVEVAQAKSGTWAMRHWACQCYGLAFLGRQAVSVNAKDISGPNGVTLQLEVFPQAGSGQPATLRITGIATTATADADFVLVGAISPASLLVDYGISGGTNAGNFQSLYHVNSAGQATQYGQGTQGQLPQDTGTGFGGLGDFSTNQAGSEISLIDYATGGLCGSVAHGSSWTRRPAP